VAPVSSHHTRASAPVGEVTRAVSAKVSDGGRWWGAGGGGHDDIWGLHVLSS